MEMEWVPSGKVTLASFQYQVGALYRVTQLLASPLLAKIDKTFQIQFCSNDVVQQDKLDTLNTTNVITISQNNKNDR